MKILLTSGGTKVPIDDVRYIGNMSSGRYGAELAEEFYAHNHDTIFFHAIGSRQPSADVHTFGQSFSKKRITFKDYDEYLGVIELAKLETPDIIISAAAVSDYIVEKTIGKISSDADELTIHLKKAKKILPEFHRVSPKSMVVGFKLLVTPSYQDVQKAVQKVLNNGADFVVFNDLSQIRKGNDSRLLFRKDMSFIEAKNAGVLTTTILNEYSTWSDR